MPSFLAEMPYWLAVGVLAAIGLARGQMMYWLGRGVTEGALRTSRRHQASEDTPRTGPLRKTMMWLDRGGADPGVRALHRWGLVMVPLSYVTVGFQSMVQAGAGILRISWWKYLLAQLPGAITWGLFYATGGFLVWTYLFSQARTYPAGAAIALLAVAALIAVIVRFRRNHPRPAKCPIPGISEADGPGANAPADPMAHSSMERSPTDPSAAMREA